jgi:hypothetical protein
MIKLIRAHSSGIEYNQKRFYPHFGNVDDLFNIVPGQAAKSDLAKGPPTPILATTILSL